MIKDKSEGPALAKLPSKLVHLPEKNITHSGHALPSVGSVGCMCCAKGLQGLQKEARAMYQTNPTEMLRELEDTFATPAGCEPELLLLLAAQEEARTTLARTQEDAAIEAQDALSQADEALVMG